MDRIAIITGGSKGLGKALTGIYVNNGYRVFSIARSKVDIENKNIIQFQTDLGEISKIEKSFLAIMKLIDKKSTKKITLINNAGMIGDIKPHDKVKLSAIEQTINLNVTAPLMLDALFVDYLRDWTCDKTIINISSGAANNAIASWSTYCSSKAALEMHTKVMALEQAEIGNGAKIVAIAPGVVDTNMQVEIRSSAKEDFKDLDRFITLKEENNLLSPEEVGAIIFNADENGKLSNGSITNINELKE